MASVKVQSARAPRARKPSPIEQKARFTECDASRGKIELVAPFCAKLKEKSQEHFLRNLWEGLSKNVL